MVERSEALYAVRLREKLTSHGVQENTHESEIGRPARNVEYRQSEGK